MNPALLEARNVSKRFPVTKGLIFGGNVGWIHAVEDVSFHIDSGETLGLVGESGCGKSTTAKMVLLLEHPTGGEILYEGVGLEEMSGADLQRYRSTVQAVFQDPQSSLNPRMRVGDIVGEPLEVNGKLSRHGVRERVAEVLNDVNMEAAFARLYPHEFSGGQRQRIALARALATHSRLIVLDEPVASLDASIRSQIINLLKDLQDQHGLSYLLITHDLAVSRHLSHRVAVMYLGRIVEEGKAEALYAEPLHPYTRALIAAALPVRAGRESDDTVVAGEVPNPMNPPRGCHFHPRCPVAMPRCAEEEPVLQEVGAERKVACHLF
jgi:oligopeptide/dipeptide ABC transporter ATP-binding protein